MALSSEYSTPYGPLNDQTEVPLLKTLVLEQNAALDLLETIAGGGGGGVERTPVGDTATGDGTVAAGKLSVAFLASSDFEGTVAGADLFASAPVSFNAPAGGTLGAIPYTVEAGSLSFWYF